MHVCHYNRRRSVLSPYDPAPQSFSLNLTFQLIIDFKFASESTCTWAWSNPCASVSGQYSCIALYVYCNIHYTSALLQTSTDYHPSAPCPVVSAFSLTRLQLLPVCPSCCLCKSSFNIVVFSKKTFLQSHRPEIRVCLCACVCVCVLRGVCVCLFVNCCTYSILCVLSLIHISEPTRPP